MAKNIRHRDEIIKEFHSDIQNKAEDETQYNQIKDTVMIELLCDIRDNIHHIAKNLRPDNHEDHGD